MTETPEEIVRRLQAQTDALSKGSIELNLGTDPALYQLPPCISAGVDFPEVGMAQLRLDTQRGHRLMIPLSDEAVLSLRNILNLFVKERDK
jgi:hypothetical protein